MNKNNNRQGIKVQFTDRTLWSRYLTYLGIISSIVTLVSFFFTASSFDGYVWHIAAAFVLGIVLLFLIMWYCANRLDVVNLRINNTDVRIVPGDILAQLDKKPVDRNGEINVIGVNDFFDVIVDDRIIAASSLHGKYIKKIVDAGKLDELNKVIETDGILNASGNSRIEESRIVGKKRRYEIGSVVEFESYVLAAFTRFDSRNEAWLSAEEYVGFWMRFWENIDRIYAGRTINIPLMGAGITRFKNGKPSKQELLEVMLWTMKISGFHNTYADKQVNFVIYPKDAPEIDFYHIQYNPVFK